MGGATAGLQDVDEFGVGVVELATNEVEVFGESSTEGSGISQLHVLGENLAF